VSRTWCKYYKGHFDPLELLVPTPMVMTPLFLLILPVCTVFEEIL